MSAVALVVTTVATQDDADRIARALVERGLVACAQIAPVRSVFRWDGALREAQELRIEMKIRAADYADLETALRALHPYETPEIVRIDIAGGYRPYLDWVDHPH